MVYIKRFPKRFRGVYTAALNRFDSVNGAYVYIKRFPKRIRGVYTAALNRFETDLKLV